MHQGSVDIEGVMTEYAKGIENNKWCSMGDMLWVSGFLGWGLYKACMRSKIMVKRVFRTL